TEQVNSKYKPKRRLSMRWKDIRFTMPVTVLSSIFGFIIGALPGAGATIASVVAYQQSKLIAKQPKLYGKGSIEAVAGVDAAGNAASAGSVIPTMGLGIPGSPAMVLVLAVLIIHGITPGPALFRSNPASIMATIGTLIVAPIILFLCGYVSVKPSLFLISNVNPRILRLGALIVSLTGVYALRSNIFDVKLAIIIGFISFLMMVFKYPIMPAAIAIVLGGVIETNLRRGLVMTLGSYSGFFFRIPVLVILGIGVLTLLWERIRNLFDKKDKNEQTKDSLL
ncbi:MAG: tripartite tricarboxylate transporter permease, partial [Negativicutes bacterium]